MPERAYAIGEAVRVWARHDAMHGRAGLVVAVRRFGVGDEVTVEFVLWTGERETLAYWDYELEAADRVVPHG